MGTQQRTTKEEGNEALSRRALLRAAGAAGVGLVGGATVLAAWLSRSRPTPASAIGSPRVDSPRPTPKEAARVLARDVVDFQLRGPFKWNGGSVTMKLHAAHVGGARAYFVRTDASDAAFASSAGLVFVPLLAATLRDPSRWLGELYLFEGTAPAQLPVIGAVPGDPHFTSLFRLHRVRFAGTPTLLDSVEGIRAAEREGRLRVEATNIVVNYPIVKWPTGELPVDRVVEKPLEGGPLLAPPDTERMLVTFKLHQCYPESRYIVTDTSAVPMAPMMNIAGSPRTEALDAIGATDVIIVFANGIPGPGAMGFQPGIFGSKAGSPTWSPMWDHWTAVWKDPTMAVLLHSRAEVEARVKAGEIDLYHGTPDTNGRGFIVNCPSPIVAPNDFVVTG